MSIHRASTCRGFRSCWLPPSSARAASPSTSESQVPCIEACILYVRKVTSAQCAVLVRNKGLMTTKIYFLPFCRFFWGRAFQGTNEPNQRRYMVYFVSGVFDDDLARFRVTTLGLHSSPEWGRGGSIGRLVEVPTKVGVIKSILAGDSEGGRVD